MFLLANQDMTDFHPPLNFQKAQNQSQPCTLFAKLELELGFFSGQVAIALKMVTDTEVGPCAWQRWHDPA